MEDLKRAGERLRILRKQRHMRILDLSDATPYSMSYIQKVERGRESPGIQFVATMAEYFGVPITYFYGNTASIQISGIAVDDQGRALRCPECGNEDYGYIEGSDKTPRWCYRCGAPLFNFCTKTECRMANRPDARFCIHCGSKTEWYSRGYLGDGHTKNND